MLIVQDVHLEDEPGWKVVNALDVNNPLAEGYRLVPTSSGLRSYITGDPYSGACGSLTQRVQEGYFHPSLSLEVMPDECVETNAQVNEFDLRIQVGEWNYNFSGQLNLAKQGMWQLVDSSEAWVDTEFVPGPLVAGMWNVLRLDYEFNLADQTFSTLQVQVNHETWTVPDSYHHVPASRKDWDDMTATIQVQIGLNHLGGGCSHKIRNVTIHWQ